MKSELNLTEILHKLRGHLPLLQEKYHVDTLRVFGSYVRQEQTADSDLDILVTFSELPGLLEFITLENYLTDLLGVQVDLVLEDSLKPALSPIIQAEALSL